MQKVKCMDHDSMRVRTFFCKLFKDSSEPYSMTMELTKLLDSRGDTLSRLYRRAEECEITKHRVMPEGSDSSEDDKPRKKKSSARRKVNAAIGEQDSEGDTVAAAVASDSVLSELKTLKELVTTMSAKVGALTDLVTEQSDDLKAMRKLLKSARFQDALEDPPPAEAAPPAPPPQYPPRSSPPPAWGGKGGWSGKGGKGGKGGQAVGSPSYTGCQNCGAMDHYAFRCPKKAKPEVVQEAIAATQGEQWYEDSYDQFDGDPASWVAACYEGVDKISTQLQQTHEKTKAEVRELEKKLKKGKKKAAAKKESKKDSASNAGDDDGSLPTPLPQLRPDRSAAQSPPIDKGGQSNKVSVADADCEGEPYQSAVGENSRVEADSISSSMAGPPSLTGMPSGCPTELASDSSGSSCVTLSYSDGGRFIPPCGASTSYYKSWYM